MHKRNYSLTSGECLNDENYSILHFEAKADGENISILLPDQSELDAVIGTQKWMVRRGGFLDIATDSGGVEIVPPSAMVVGSGDSCPSDCKDSRLEW